MLVPPTDAIAPFQSMRPGQVRLSGLDSARGLAIVMVVIFHYFHERIFGGLVNIAFAPLGLAGVTLFFLISGFLIERHLHSDGNLIRYFSRRVFRILPGYIACLAVVVLIDQWTHPSGSWTLFQVSANATLLQDLLGTPMMLGIFWTLLIEIKFYAMAPFVKRAGVVALRCAPYVAIAANCTVYVIRHEASTLLTYLTFCFVGMQFGPWSRGTMSTRELAGLVVLVAAITAIVGAYFAIGHAIFVVINAAVLAIALRLSLQLAVMPFIGTVSYSWYLYHAAVGFPLIAFLERAMPGTGVARLLVVSCAVAASLVAAWISFMLVERPGIALGHTIEKKLLLWLGADAASESTQRVI